MICPVHRAPPSGRLTAPGLFPSHGAMPLRPSHLAALAAAALTLLPGVASATNYSLWIHGRNTSQSTQPGNYADFSYWGPSSTAAGVNKKAVNWDGVSHISAQNSR